MTQTRHIDYQKLLIKQFNSQIAFREQKPGTDKLLLPLFHEDGDMVDIFLEYSTQNSGRLRICDYGLTVMRLSYSYELNTPNKLRIFHRILDENQLSEDNGNIFLEVELENLYSSILHFAHVISKIASMEYFKREVIKSLFYEMLDEFIMTDLRKFSPSPEYYPIPEREDIRVDFKFDIDSRPIFLFGAKDQHAARLAVMSCLFLQRENIRFKSIVVHEDLANLPKKDYIRITSASDKQFPSFDDFQKNAVQFLEREIP